MATALLSIGAPDATIPGFAITAPEHPAAPANDTLPCWTTDPRAVRILASCVKNPPRCTRHRQQFGWSVDEWYTYSGTRVRTLTAIRDELGQAPYLHFQATGVYAPFEEWCLQPDVKQAIDAALDAGFNAKGR
jgi:hypothetical protein